MKVVIAMFGDHYLRSPNNIDIARLLPRIEISDISADISAIYRISAFIKAIFPTENRLEEKSEKIGKCQRNIAEISVDISEIGVTCAWEKFTGFFSSIYRRYIENIGKILEIYRKYR